MGVVVEVHDTDAAGVAPLFGDAIDRHPNGHAGIGDEEQLVLRRDHQRRYDVAFALAQSDRPNALCATLEHAELRRVGALSESLVGDDEQLMVRSDNVG